MVFYPNYYQNERLNYRFLYVSKLYLCSTNKTTAR